jgi:hypothetical protein
MWRKESVKDSMVQMQNKCYWKMNPSNQIAQDYNISKSVARKVPGQQQITLICAIKCLMHSEKINNMY